MSIQTAIYKALAGDVTLAGLLASSTIDSTKPAIYEAWATADAPMPYMNLTFSHAEGNHWAKRDTALDIDIFTNQDSTNAEIIKNRVMKILDRQKISLENGTNARCHSDSDGMVAEPLPNVTHWNISFSVYYWRKNWIEAT